MISTTINRWPYNGDGSRKIFPFTNRVDDATWIRAYVDGALATLATDYSVAGIGNPAGGAVTFVVAPPNGDDNVIILRKTPITQLLTLPFEGRFPSSAIERNGLDTLCMMIQDLYEQIERCPKFTPYSAFRNIDMPDPEDGMVLGWSGNRLVNLEGGGGGM